MWGMLIGLIFAMALALACDDTRPDWLDEEDQTSRRTEQ